MHSQNTSSAHNKQSDEWIEHERFLPNEDYFKTAVSKISDKIASETLESIWYGISQVHKRPQICTDMDEIFNEEIKDEEFNTVIAIASTKTAPSQTGLKFKRSGQKTPRKRYSQHSATWGIQRKSLHC